MKTTAVVIARGGSARLPNKNLLTFYGRPLVAHKVWQLKQCKFIDEVVVGSDSEAILTAAVREGALPLQREPEFCDEKSRSWNDVIHNMVSQLDATTIVWAHCTNPCISPSTYDRAIRCFMMTDGDSLVSVTPFRNHVWWNGRPLNFDPYNKPHEPARVLPPIYFQNGGIFIAKRRDMETWRYVYGKTPEMFQIDASEAVDVDTQEDLDKAKEWYGTF
jgi:CMP-N-acetylneuraminic acid synthetase